MNNITNDIAIIGAGPAGIAAAVQLIRSGFNPLIFEQNRVGGLLRNANLVENYPGFPKGISGQKLSDLFERQLEGHSPRIIHSEVKTVKYEESQFKIECDDRSYSAKILIVASGTKPVPLLGISYKPEFLSNVFHEVKDIADAKDKKIAIIGGGDAAFDYALNLQGENDVIILNRSSKTKCLPLLKQRAAQSDRIMYISTAVLKSAKPGDGKLLLNYTVSGVQNEIVVDYLLIAIGRVPNFIFVNIAQDNIKQLLSTGKLFFAGDIKNGIYRQTTISVGDGVRAAMEVRKDTGN